MGKKTTIYVDLPVIRYVKIVNDQNTQSVNISTARNITGEYEQVFYFRDKFFVTEQEIRRHRKLATLTNWLRKRSYKQLCESLPPRS